MRKKTHEEFIAEMSIINPNIEILSIYINNRTKVLCRCRIDGYEWYAAPANLLKGQGCKKCSDNSKRKTHATFMSKARTLATLVVR